MKDSVYLKKGKIITYLAKYGKTAQGTLSKDLGLDYYHAEKLLTELHIENKVHMIQETRATYWEVKQ